MTVYSLPLYTMDTKVDGMKLEIIYQDDYLVVINKPHGLLVHKTKLAAHQKLAALQLVRDQLHRKVYPAHRIERKTSVELLL